MHYLSFFVLVRSFVVLEWFADFELKIVNFRAVLGSWKLLDGAWVVVFSSCCQRFKLCYVWL